MFWKIYFWFIAVLLVLFFGDIFFVGFSADYNLADYEGILEGVVIFLALLSYVFKKNIFNTNVWKVVFIWLIVVWVVQLLVYSGSLQLDIVVSRAHEGTFGSVLSSVILGIPALVAMYRLGFKNN